MARTTFTSAVNFADDAAFRAMGAAWRAAFEAVGLTLIQGSSTVNWATVNKPTTTNETVAYEVYQLPAISGLDPMYISVDYGSCGSANRLKMWLSVGFAINESTGMLSGAFYAQNVVLNSGYTSTVTSHVCCASGSLVVCASDAINGYSLNTVLVERTRNADGTCNDDGAVCATFLATNYKTSGYILRDASYNLGANNVNCVPVPGSSNVVDTTVYTTPLRAVGRIEYPPVLGCVQYFNGDLTSMVPVTATMWNGVAHTILPLGGYGYGCETYGMGGLTNSRCAILWDEV